MTDPLDLSVLIPARNEVENLPSLLMEIRAALAAEDYEVLVVDDGSSDRTLSVLHQLKSQGYTRLRILRHERSLGQSTSLWRAAQAACGSGWPDGQNDQPWKCCKAATGSSRLWNRRIGVIAALLFLATYQSYSILRTGQIDSFLCLWVALGF